MPLFAPVIEEDFLRSQAALLEQVNNLQPLLDSPHIKGKRSFNIVVVIFYGRFKVALHNHFLIIFHNAHVLWCLNLYIDK